MLPLFIEVMILSNRLDHAVRCRITGTFSLHLLITNHSIENFFLHPTRIENLFKGKGPLGAGCFNHHVANVEKVTEKVWNIIRDILNVIEGTFAPLLTL
jgi:hypothetical protein